MLWDLFITFFKMGFAAFGGGYAMIPIMELEVKNHGWLTAQQFTDIIAISSASPGPIATNCAIFIGYHTAGLTGAAVAALGTTMPSLLIIFAVATFYYKAKNLSLIQSAFYGIRPVITGLICYAAIRLAVENQLIGGEKIVEPISILIMFGALSLLFYTRIHPVFVIILSGFFGVMCF